MYMLRKLLLNIGDLPAQTSHILFNYLVKPPTYTFICLQFSLDSQLTISKSLPPRWD